MRRRNTPQALLRTVGEGVVLMMAFCALVLLLTLTVAFTV